MSRKFISSTKQESHPHFFFRSTVFSMSNKSVAEFFRRIYASLFGFIGRDQRVVTYMGSIGTSWIYLGCLEAGTSWRQLRGFCCPFKYPVNPWHFQTFTPRPRSFATAPMSSGGRVKNKFSVKINIRVKIKLPGFYLKRVLMI